ncbi:KxYKxGKxW signal peptide domain-containing protein, partial [Staphylococcus gallinarum]|uniref:KxYKxGKxW signal peptide domain-containing protein n=1 Tax=Staphylococcus gallinarum TaxID=1293 RepID=UPI0031739E8A
MLFFKSMKNIKDEPKHRVKLYKVGKHWVQKGINELNVLISMNLPSKPNKSKNSALKKAVLSITMGSISSIYTLNNNARADENSLPVTSEISAHSETLGNNNSTNITSQSISNVVENSESTNKTKSSEVNSESTNKTKSSEVNSESTNKTKSSE